MNEVGLLQPIVVTERNHLIAGQRRLEAAKLLKWKHVAVRVVNLDDPFKRLRAEHDENVCRQDFTPSEKVAIGRALEKREGKNAKERQAQAGPTTGKGKKASASGKIPEPLKGETRDRVAGQLDMSGKTYEKAKAVVEAAERDPEKFGPVVEEMDRSGKVDPAFKKVKLTCFNPAPEKNGKAKDHGIGVKKAKEAIACLQQIPKDDPLRERGLEMVRTWLTEAS
jgi:hypothetical protein